MIIGEEMMIFIRRDDLWAPAVDANFMSIDMTGANMQLQPILFVYIENIHSRQLLFYFDFKWSSQFSLFLFANEYTQLRSVPTGYNV